MRQTQGKNCLLQNVKFDGNLFLSNLLSKQLNNLLTDYRQINEILENPLKR
jgi:hypothetical protein